MKQLDACECYKQELSATNLWRIKVKHSENLSMTNLSNAVNCPSPYTLTNTFIGNVSERHIHFK
jgi:hypothetical protein